MPQYKVLGFDRITGQNVGISVEAPSRDEAVKDSRAKTMLIWKVIEIPNESDEVPEPMWEAPPPVSERSPQPYDGILSNATTLDTIGGVIQLLGVLAFIGGVIGSMAGFANANSVVAITGIAGIFWSIMTIGLASLFKVVAHASLAIRDIAMKS